VLEVFEVVFTELNRTISFLMGTFFQERRIFCIYNHYYDFFLVFRRELFASSD
jgi:hypothetical protein